MNRLIFVLAILLLSACQAAVQTGGSGQTSLGEPLAGTLSFSHKTNQYAVVIQSPAGWSCGAKFVRSGQNLSSRTVPLTCNDGRKGRLIMTSNQYQYQFVGSFRLSNGEAGQVTFGRS